MSSCAVQSTKQAFPLASCQMTVLSEIGDNYLNYLEEEYLVLISSSTIFMSRTLRLAWLTDWLMEWTRKPLFAQVSSSRPSSPDLIERTIINTHKWCYLLCSVHKGSRSGDEKMDKLTMAFGSEAAPTNSDIQIQWWDSTLIHIINGQ